MTSPDTHTRIAALAKQSTSEMGHKVTRLDPARRARLAETLSTLEDLLGEKNQRKPIIRNHRIGDMGHIISRHGVLYAEEYGWDITFERAVAEIGAAFLKEHDPARECCLVAELDGDIAGSATMVRLDQRTARLRIVYVEPWARGHGLGEQLVTACMDFARGAGYAEMKLWTNDVLKPARRLYDRLGFRLVESAPHRSFGQDMAGEIWWRVL